jgi:hypothetical protein
MLRKTKCAKNIISLSNTNGKNIDLQDEIIKD